MLTIKRGAKSFYVGDSERKPLAEMVFVEAGKGLIIIEHTEVKDQLRGQNMGSRLLEQVVELARAEKKKIMPLCPFANREMGKRREEFADVLDQ